MCQSPLRLGPDDAVGLEKIPIVFDEAQVFLPIPVGARIGMAMDPAA